jgi:ubiquinone biosynthesis accessory factor UbiJ
VNAAARQPKPILVRLGAMLEAALNRALVLDEETASRIGTLEGQRIGVELRTLNLALAISVQDGKLRVGPHWERTSDLNLRATPGSLLSMALRRGDDSPLPPGKVEISGDAELARRIEKLMRDFRPDIEEAFARSFGDVIGVPLARGLHRAFMWSRESANALVQDTAEYLRDERRDLVAPAEMEQFLDDVDALRERGDRLEARIKRLLQRARGDAA